MLLMRFYDPGCMPDTGMLRLNTRAWVRLYPTLADLGFGRQMGGSMKVQTNGIELSYSVEGQGPWLVMSHSLACNQSMWDEQAQLLKSRYRVLRFNTGGHGGGDAPAGPYTLKCLPKTCADCSTHFP